MYRVLAVSQNPRNHELLHDALAQDFEIHALDGDNIALQDITRTFVEKNVDLIILDVDLRDLNGLSVLGSLRTDTTTQNVPIVMVVCGDVDSQTVMAFNNGATDCLALPCSRLVVRARIRAACRRSPMRDSARPADQAGRLIGFIGAKGGVGTTTVAVNTGVALVEKELQVTIVDLRGYFGTMAAHLGVYPDEHPHNIADLLEESTDNITAESVEKLLVHHASGMNVLLGAQHGDGYHRVTSEQAESLVTSLRGHAHFTIFDLPACPTEAVETVIKNCDQVLVVLEREPASVQAAKVLFSTLVADGVLHGDIGAVVVHRAAVSSPIPLEYLREQLCCPIVAMIPPASEACAAAARSREPLIQFRHDSDCAEALENFANKLTGDHLPALAF